MKRQIILASTSPRRRELLEKMGIPFRVIPSDFAEWLDHAVSPEEMAETLGLGKARAVRGNTLRQLSSVPTLL